MFLKFLHIADGPGPSEMIVGIRTADGGMEEVVISKRQADGHDVDVGEPLLHERDRYLVELPRESAKGRWRVWVSQSEASHRPSVQAAE